jgi:predicted ester cyclase
VSSDDENKALARRFLDAFANADLHTLDELLAPEFINHSLLPGQAPGREGYIQSAAEQHAGFSDIRYIIDYQATDGDMVITRLTMRAIHDRGAVLFGVGPTGRDWVFTNIVIDRLCEGKIVEEWSADTISPFLETLRQEIRERERVEQEFRVARIIQEASLPKEVPQLEGWEISPLYRPAREVGGDFYDFFELEDGRVGDATGKGVPAALVVTATYSMLRAVAQALGSFAPGEVLAQVNETLLARIPLNMFVTCFYAILEPKRGQLVYATRATLSPAVSGATTTKPTSSVQGDAPRPHERHELRGESDNPCTRRRRPLLLRWVGRGTRSPRRDVRFPSSQRLPERALRYW